MKLVSTIEEGMHKEFKDTSHRYKAKYRTLMFNLKDPRNKVNVLTLEEKRVFDKQQGEILGASDWKNFLSLHKKHRWVGNKLLL